MDFCYNEIVREVKADTEPFNLKSCDLVNKKGKKPIEKCVSIVSTKTTDVETEHPELWLIEEPSKISEISVVHSKTYVESKIQFINDLIQLVNDNVNSAEELTEATKLAKPLMDKLKGTRKHTGTAFSVSVPKMDIVEFQTLQTPANIQIIHATPAQVIDAQHVQLEHVQVMEGTQVLHGLAQVAHLATNGISTVEQETLSLPLIKLDSIFQTI
ncbi:unnamed protein product [Acanthoscelides obtectus]|nr:unnamed protein product [Acanthoscelides obtectus]CAK1669336.1 hypothetical protein AOBTE_LOCUS26958 [Acanthoscelides obtectus]